MNPQESPSINNADGSSMQPQVFEPSSSAPQQQPVSPSVPPQTHPSTTSPQSMQAPPQQVPKLPVEGVIGAPPQVRPDISPVQAQAIDISTPQPLPSANSVNTPQPQPIVIGGTQPSTDNELVKPSTQPSFQTHSADIKKRRPGKKLLLVVAAIVALGLGGSAFAYTSIMNNSPEKILADSLANTMTDVLDKKTYQLASSIKFESKSATNPYKVSINLDAKQAGENGQVDATVHLESGMSMNVSVSGSIVAEGSDAAYIKLNNIQKSVNDIVATNPALAPMATKLRPLIQKLDGKWIKIDEKGLVSMGAVDSEEKVDECSNALKNLRISKEDKKQIKEIFINNQFAIVSEELPAEKVDGENSFHYKLDLNEEAGNKFAKEFVEVKSFADVKKACDVKPEDIDKDAKKYNENKDGEIEAKPVIELWVSKKTRYPTQFKLSVADKELTMDQMTQIKINAGTTTVEIPKDFMTLEQLKTEIEKTMKELSDPTMAGGMTQGWSSWRR